MLRLLRCKLSLFLSMLVFNLHCGQVYAQDNDTCETEECAIIDQLSLSFALGYGVKSNPLASGDDRALYLIPDVAWYGEKWYIDNTEIGYQWLDRESFAFETFVTVNNEKAHFNRSHSGNFFFDASIPGNSLVEGTPDAPPSPDIGDTEEPPFVPTSISLDDIAKRKFALDVGLRFHKYVEDSEWTLTFLQDASGVHDGQQLALEYKYGFSVNQWRFGTAAKLTWKSSNLIDYYYGLDESDNVDLSQYYRGSSGIYPSLRISVAHPISDQWQWFAYAKYEFLDNGMTNSPLVDENQVTTLFTGVSYRF